MKTKQMDYKKKSINSKHLILAVLVVSGLTHLWNAAGFPDIFYDEGVYMRRAMHVMAGLGPQESFFHDHPFFGQIFLASLLGMIGFPSVLHPSPDPNSISTLYLMPRIIMGVLAVADTFLIYKITQCRYGTKVALISSMLFAVMPITWLVRRILLDSILLPFLLASIFLAMHTNNPKHKKLMILLSGVLMGTAIFTKIPAFAMIPLVAGLVYYNEKNFKSVALWAIPVFLIPLMWPLQSVESGEFNLWLHDVVSQTQRHSYGLPYISGTFLQMDPVLFILGLGGIAFCIFRKDYFILMWFLPFIIFLLSIGYNQYFYWIPVLPVFCIGASVLIVRFLDSPKMKKMHKNLMLVTVLGLGIFGLTCSMLLVTTNMTSSQFQAASFVLHHVGDTNNDTTVLASPAYSWIFNYVFHRPNVFMDYSLAEWQPITTKKTLLIVDLHYLRDPSGGSQVMQVLNSTTVATFYGNAANSDITQYPYTNIKVNYDGSKIEIKEKD